MEAYNEDRIWELVSRKLSGEATNDELLELDKLLRGNPHINYSKEILHDLWENNPEHDSHYAENKYRELVSQIQNMGIDEGKFNQDDHYIDADAEPEKKGKRKKWFFALASITILVITGVILFQARPDSDKKDLAEAQSNNEISTKNGSKTNLVLPDGTKVWLNAGSQLNYLKDYGNKLREVTLSGKLFLMWLKMQKSLSLSIQLKWI